MDDTPFPKRQKLIDDHEADQITPEQEEMSNAESIRDFDSLPMIERLPRELAWQLIEYVPESIRNLRLASRVLKLHVDDYVVRHHSFIDELRFPPMSADEKETLVVSIIVHNEKCSLFDLRSKIILSRFGLDHHFKCVSRKCYRLVPDISADTEDDVLKCLIHIFGRTIRALFLFEYSDPSTFTVIAKLLDGIKVSRIRITIGTITDDTMKDLFKIIEKHQVDTISLFVKRISTTDPVGFLFDLSSRVRAIRIYQKGAFDASKPYNYMIGIPNADWSSIILEMFSRKVDKLWIQNSFYSGYLPINSANSLKEKLPKINKQVWFNASLHYLDGNVSHESNDNVVQVGLYDCYRVLTVKHKSRVDERF